jgi:hypothetical protein
MSVENSHRFHSDGRLRGSYVYMLLCRDDGPVYIKIGISDAPSKRLMALRTACPVQPRQFCFVEVRSRSRARTIEKQLHFAMDAWHTQGEWFRVAMHEKPAFNQAWRSVLNANRETGWRYEWERISVPAFAKQLDQNRRAMLARMRHYILDKPMSCPDDA